MELMQNKVMYELINRYVDINNAIVFNDRIIS